MRQLYYFLITKHKLRKLTNMYNVEQINKKHTPSPNPIKLEQKQN